MTISTYLIGIIPPDEKYKRMKQIWDLCRKESISIPKEVSDFFGGEEPGELGMEIKLDDSVEQYKDDEREREGLKIDVAKIPKNVKSLVFYNSW